MTATVDVWIYDCETGGTVILNETLPVDENGHVNTYIWSDGNYSCDCNRGLLFRRAKGLPEEEPAPCDTGIEKRFVVTSIYGEDGVLIYREGVSRGWWVTCQMT